MKRTPILSGFFCGCYPVQILFANESVMTSLELINDLGQSKVVKSFDHGRDLIYAGLAGSQSGDVFLRLGAKIGVDAVVQSGLFRSSSSQAASNVDGAVVLPVVDSFVASGSLRLSPGLSTIDQLVNVIIQEVVGHIREQCTAVQMFTIGNTHVSFFLDELVLLVKLELKVRAFNSRFAHQELFLAVDDFIVDAFNTVVDQVDGCVAVINIQEVS